MKMNTKRWARIGALCVGLWMLTAPVRAEECTCGGDVSKCDGICEAHEGTMLVNCTPWDTVHCICIDNYVDIYNTTCA